MKLIYKRCQKTIKDRLVDVNLKYLENPDNVYILDEKKRLETLLQGLSNEIKNANVDALKLMNGELTNVFYINYNFGVYMAEQLSGYDLERIVFNRDILKKLIAENQNPFTKIALNEIKDKKKIYRELKRIFLQATIQGDSIPKLAKEIQNLLDKNYKQAVTIARTETTRIQNLGRQESFNQSKKLGLKVKKQWISTVDPRTRESHLRMNLETADLDDKFSNGLEYPGDLKGGAKQVVNCFIGETYIYSDSEIKNTFKHWFEGTLIHIKTTKGISFTCTPNHPILTDKGWIQAGFLNKGDKVIIGEIANDFVIRINPNINTINPNIGEVHNSINNIFPTKWVTGRKVNFHTYIPNTDVEIVFTNSFLQNRLISLFNKKIKNFKFKFPTFIRIFLSANSFFFQLFNRGRSIFSNFISFLSYFFPFFKRSILHSYKHSLAFIPSRNIINSQNSINDLPRNTMTIRQCLNGFTGIVSTDDIIMVEKMLNFKGHVYNLHTYNNLYMVNNISQKNDKGNYIGVIAHNCRCTHTIVYEGLEDDSKLKELDENIKKMTFDEWVRRYGG